MLPEEKFDQQSRCNLRLLESKWCKRLFFAMPILVIILIPLVSRYLLWVLFLHPVESPLQWSSLFSIKAVALSSGIVVVPVIWWCGLKLEGKKQFQLSAVVLMALVVIGANSIFASSKVRWTFVEWAKIRTPNPSFARNTLFWEQRKFERSGQWDFEQNQKHIHLIGSSQIYQATDLQLLEQRTEDFLFEKNCLAGFGPIQYQFFWERIKERNPDVIVCWLSEFDFFRENDVPTNRLRWGSHFEAVRSLSSQLERKKFLESRGEIVDLLLAAGLPVWRNRDPIKRTVLHYWWDRSRGLQNDSREQVNVLAKSAGIEEALGYMKKSITRSQMLEVNFRCFEDFANRCEEANIELLVFEGQSHPLAVAAYDAHFKTETRERLIAMSQACGFRYYPQFEIPKFTQAEFGDAYHLNEQGRKRWTEFLAQTLNQQKETDH